MECRVGVVVGQVSKDRQPLYDIVSIPQSDATQAMAVTPPPRSLQVAERGHLSVAHYAWEFFGKSFAYQRRNFCGVQLICI